jgi:hypothetical protein
VTVSRATMRTSPIAPLASRARSFSIAGTNLGHVVSIRKGPRLRAVFSQSTGFPASSESRLFCFETDVASPRIRCPRLGR